MDLLFFDSVELSEFRVKGIITFILFNMVLLTQTMTAVAFYGVSLFMSQSPSSLRCTCQWNPVGTDI